MKKIVILIVLSLLIPISFANGGCIKIADDVFVQLTSAPLVPVADKEVSYLISFGNKKGLIAEEINVKLKIVQNEKIILTKDFKIKDGILDFKYTFKEAGLYEIFLEFEIKDKIYMPEDFLIEVKEQEINLKYNILFLLMGVVIGVILIKLIKK